MPDALDAVLVRLDALGTKEVRARRADDGAAGRQYGVRLGDLRTLAKELKTDHDLALALWATDNVDARLLSVLVARVRALAPDDIDAMARSIGSMQVADWFHAYILKKHSARQALRERWLDAGDPLALRFGWALTADRIAKESDGLDLDALLDRIEVDLADAPPEAQWTMNRALVEIGIHAPTHRDRALSVGEALGVYRDFPVSRGCTSPFAPEWIREMVGRQG